MKPRSNRNIKKKDKVSVVDVETDEEDKYTVSDVYLTDYIERSSTQ